MKLAQKKNKHRTLLFEGEQHVGTIVEQSKKLFLWIAPSGSAHVSSYAAAYQAIIEELQR